MTNDNPKRRGAGLKIDNSKSSVEPPKTPTSEVFEQKANEALKRIEGYKKRFWELSGQFKAMITDRVLVDNKSPIAKNIEGEVLNNLVQVASEMNADATQPEGFGSITLDMLLMKMLLLQRDTINAMAYKISELEKTVSNQK